MTTTTKKYQLSPYVEADVYKRVKALAEAEGLSMSRVGLEIIMLGLPAREEISKQRKAELGIS